MRVWGGSLLCSPGIRSWQETLLGEERVLVRAGLLTRVWGYPLSGLVWWVGQSAPVQEQSKFTRGGGLADLSPDVWAQPSLTGWADGKLSNGECRPLVALRESHLEYLSRQQMLPLVDSLGNCKGKRGEIPATDEGHSGF